MRKTTLMVMTFAVLLVATAFGVGNDDVLLYCDYDGEANATFAAGDGTATHAVKPEFQKGVSGQALVVGGDPQGEQKIIDGVPKVKSDGRNCYYSPEKNIDVASGTISFWVKPLDWSGEDKGFNTLFHTRVGDQFFQIYKFFSDTRLIFLRGAQNKWAMAHYRIRNWEPGQWHHVAATWNPTEVNFYIDGHLVCRRGVETPFQTDEKVEPLSVGPGGAWSKGYIGRSLIDEFRIHGKPLNRAEVAELFRQCSDNVEIPTGRNVIGKKTPALDGVLKEFEYSLVGPGLSAPGGPPPDQNDRYGFSYDQDNLYVSVQSDFPETAKRGPSKRDGDLSESERVELFLRPPGNEKPMYRFQFAPSGAVRDEKDGDATWNCDGVKAENVVTDGSWTLEAAIPFAALGLKTPVDDETWRVNLGRVHASRGDKASIAPVLESLDDQAHFIDLEFLSDAPLVNLLKWRDEKNGRQGPRAAVKNARENSSVRYDVITDTTEGYGLKARSYPLFADGKYTPHAPAWKVLDGGVSLKDLTVNETKVVESINGKETTLYRREKIVENDAPLRVFYLYTKDKKRLFVSALKRADGDIQAQFLRKDGSVAFETSEKLPTDSSYFNVEFDLDFDKLRPETYMLVINHVAPDGTTRKMWEQEYRIPEPDAPEFQPYVDPEADQVPAPWTPLEIGDDVVRMWGRSYGLGDGALFSSLISQDEEMLTAPIALRLNGETLKPVAPPEIEKVSGSDMLAEWRKKADLGKLDVASDVKVHFDGYCEIAMTVAPKKGETVKIDKLSLDVPLRGDLVELVRDNRWSTGSKSGAVGDYWNQILEGRPFVWVGGDKAGFNWLAENLENWKFKDKEKNVEVIRQGDEVVLRLNLIDEPFDLVEPVTYRYGFCLTPSRPLDRKILRGRLEKDWQPWCQAWQYFAVPDYDAIDVDKVKARSQGYDETFLYMGTNLTSPFSPEYPWFAEEWSKNPGKWSKRKGAPTIDLKWRWMGYTGGDLKADSFYNWMQNTRAKFFEKAKKPLTPKAINYYFDAGVWVDPRCREQELNVYRMIKRTGPNAKDMIHEGWLRIPPMGHFADVIVGGEGVESWVASTGDNYYNVLTPELFRATFSPYIWGMKTAFINMLVRAATAQEKARFPEDPKAQRATRHAYGYCVTHDTDWWDHFKETREVREAVWDAQDQLGWDENVTFHPYWAENCGVTLVSPKSNRILASAYTRDGKLMLSVLNDTDQTQDVKLNLDLEKLGVKPGMNGRDAFVKDKTYVLGETWEDSIPPREFRLIVWPESSAETRGTTE